jgi:hypothetical protein
VLSQANVSEFIARVKSSFVSEVKQVVWIEEQLSLVNTNKDLPTEEEINSIFNKYL